MASGVQDRMSVSASVGISVGTQTFVFSYDSWPRIYGLQPTNSPKRGSADETLTSEISGCVCGVCVCVCVSVCMYVCVCVCVRVFVCM